MASAIPGPLVDTDEELMEIRKIYGRDAARYGFRLQMEQPLVATVMEKNAVRCTEENQRKCGPFKQDFYTAPIWFKFRDISNDDLGLPPRL